MMKVTAIGKKVRELRSKMGLTTVSLAKKLGISQAQVSRLENGLQGFRSATMMKFCRVLGVEPIYFFVEGGAAHVEKLTKELKARGLAPTSTLKNALANAAFLRFAERCAKTYRTDKQALGRMEALIKKRF